MFGNAFSGWHLVIILAIVLLLFGAPKLPALAKSVGQSMRIFKSEVKAVREDTDEASPLPGVDRSPGTSAQSRSEGDALR